MKYEGGSTKGLYIHLRSIHQIDLSKRRNNEETNVDARLSFNIFTTSPDLRKYLTTPGHSLTKSDVRIRV